MMNPMAGRMRLFAATIALVFIAAACSSGGDAEVAELQSVESTTTTPVASTTTSTIATTTTLSEQAQAEADVAQLVTDFWLTEVDTSTGEVGLEFMTGLIETRTREWATGLADAGEGLRDFEGQKRVEVTSVEVDLQVGTGEVQACMGSGSEVIDLETRQQIDIGSDPEFLSTSRLLVLKTSEGWKISEIYPSVLTGNAELCEIGN